jgi:hypothetical protein
MHLPSNVPQFDSVPLVAFDYLEPIFVLPTPRRLRSWDKVLEVTRRFDHYEWITHVVRRPAGCESFVTDLARSFLLSFESALQMLKEEVFGAQFEKWMLTQPANDLTTRGLRTLRHLEAHIRPGVLTQNHQGGHSRFAGAEGGTTIGWRWAPINVKEFHQLRRPLISVEELPIFNALIECDLVASLMRAGIIKLIVLFEAADATFVSPST